MNDDSEYIRRVESFYELMFKEFGHPHNWPTPLSKPTKLFSIRGRLIDIKVNARLMRCGLPKIDKTFRRRFYYRLHQGQDICQDAGGYIWDCWKEALGLIAKPDLTYSELEDEHIDQLRRTGQLKR